MEPTGITETSISNHHTPRNNPEDGRIRKECLRKLPLPLRSDNNVKRISFRSCPAQALIQMNTLQQYVSKQTSWQ